MPELGGLRHPKPDSVNLGWQNKSFRGYADYMGTKEFEAGIKRLMDFAKKETVAIMCAEAVPWRCHRSLVSDALLVRKVEVRHIMSRVSAPKHEMTPWAKAHGVHLTYPGNQLELKGLT